MSATMDKTFNPATYERRWAEKWAQDGLYEADPRSERPPFCIMIPPPNVTGKLHMGHALQSTLQDLITRWRRMQGYEALWLPGTDHAGIATQLMVERQLRSEGRERVEIGREAFVERAWEWTRQYGGNIRRQLDLLGASCDWSRERFTLDDGLSGAVREAFVRLYEEGLIYRAEYMVNWSPALHTAISDLEVEMKPVAGKLYHVAYPIEGSDERIVVATTRPETMLGDTAVAFHPDDERYQHLGGGHALLPVVGRRIPFIADVAVDPEFGTGLVKVTPSHDPNDFEIGRRHDLDSVQVIGPDGLMTAAAGESFSGLDRFEARERLVDRLADEGLLVQVEPHQHNVGHCQRSGVPIEPLVSTQWFADVSGMAARALAAVEDDELELIPSSWNKTWQHWLGEIRPWCISRQLWWGHQIPAWFTADGRCVVARSLEQAVEKAGTDELTRDEDVLDTWFSSALWPFSTLGWPEQTVDLERFYPTQVLITGFDILFFWVARMVMTGLHFTDALPFSKVHLTGLVRDADGQKMSKTRGNTVDPLELVEEYGADALRFTLAVMDSPGSDIPLDSERIAGYRAFGNKIWNAVRFALSRTGDARVPTELVAAELAEPERWILSRLARVELEVDVKLEAFRFDEACNALYHFFWGDLCDRYIELSKSALAGDVERPRVAETLLLAIDRSLRLLHPVMPFLTEELWQRLPGHEAIDARSIALAPYPRTVEGWRDECLEASMDLLFELVSRVRSARTDKGLPPRTPVDVVLDLPAEQQPFFARAGELLRSLAGVEGLELGAVPGDAVRDRIDGVGIGVLLPERQMTDEERQRLARDVEKTRQAIAQTEKRLSNEEFLGKAPENVVEQARQRLAEMRERLETLEERQRSAQA